MTFDLSIISPRLVLGITVVLTGCIATIYSCNRPEESKSSAIVELTAGRGFVGDQSCASCHADEFDAWRGSHHDYAMKPATEEHVRGDFSGAEVTHRGETYRFFRRDSLFLVQAASQDGAPATYRVTHTFGWEPLQQYLVDFGRGRLQALNIAWDTGKEQWFALNPNEDVRHGNWLHWTGGAMNWNTMCADCHSTNLRQNYIPEADSFATAWSSINVSCEACHGPGRDHVELMESEEGAKVTVERIRRDLKLTAKVGQEQQISQCAQCHSLREELTDAYAQSGDFLDHYSPTLPHSEDYFSDGQIRGEVYVWGSFLQSKMHAEGVQCTDCHNPHSLQLKANVTDNSLCMQCHEPRYNTLDHHKHQVNTEAAQCVNCHMPGRYYMEVDYRRDHSFRVPRPDLSGEFGTPNACNDCHSDRSPEWAARAVDQWYGPDRSKHFSETLVKADSSGAEALPALSQLLADTTNPTIARATAVWYLGQFADQEESIKLIEQALYDESTLVRLSAVRALANLPEELKGPALQDGLADSVRAVRVGAAGGLASYSVGDIEFSFKKHFQNAMEEYRQYLDAGQYFPQGQMNRGQFFERQGQPEKAIEAYEIALEKDHWFNPARLNLAYLQNRQGNNAQAEKLLNTVVEQEPSYGPAWYSLALVLAEQGRLEEALPKFEQATGLMPDNARVRYNWAISLQRLDKPEQAEQAYLQAITLDPDNPDYRYGICTLYLQQQQYGKAQMHAEKLSEQQPDHARVQGLLKMIEERSVINK